MYLCQCEAVTDRTIRAAIQAGARTVPEVARRCGAGSGCGGCWPALHALLAEARLQRSSFEEQGTHNAA